MTFGVEESIVEGIRTVLARHPAVDEAFVFGSRALRREHARSDFDLALRGRLSSVEVERIAIDLDELPVPVSFDVQDIDAIRHPALREHIIRVGKSLYRRSETPTGT